MLLLHLIDPFSVCNRHELRVDFGHGSETDCDAVYYWRKGTARNSSTNPLALVSVQTNL